MNSPAGPHLRLLNRFLVEEPISCKDYAESMSEIVAAVGRLKKRGNIIYRQLISIIVND
jgi:hypothetical protein